MGLEKYSEEGSGEEYTETKHDIIGCLRFALFVLRHPVGTYRFAREMGRLAKSFTTDVYGNRSDIWSNTGNEETQK